ncbi:MAG: site-2 protease family protein [Actinobacteria bacterium]|jgi:Zn-dependent protease|nr:site-2 protease family protein [Actinomycetota bacterium]
MSDGRRGGGLDFRLGSIPVSMPWSGVLGIVVIAFLWRDNLGYAYEGNVVLVRAVVFAVLLYVSILGHELAHAWSARAFGYPVRSITLWIFGGYTSFERRFTSAWRDGVISAAGPISSVLIGVAWLLLAASPLAASDSVYFVSFALGWTNILMGVWNALPGLPLDGGNVLKCVLWGITKDEHRGTVVAAWAGRVVAVGVFLVPAWLAWRQGRQPDLFSFVFSGFIAAWLFAGASDALKRATVMRRVPRLEARTLVRPVVVVPHDLPLSEALRRLEEQGARGIAVADATGEVVAVAQEAAVSAVPLERRPWVPVSSVAARLDPEARLHVDLSGEPLLRAMQDVPSGDYAVHDGTGRVVGILTTADVEKALSA